MVATDLTTTRASRLRTVTGVLSFICITSLLQYQRTFSKFQLGWLNREVSTKLPPCQVLITNHRANFHEEVLESILALFPSTSLSFPQTCNSSILRFDFLLQQRRRTDSWMDYFEHDMKSTVYNGTSPGEVRTVHHAHFANSEENFDISPIKANYDATIEASCYCRDEFLTLMTSSPNTACIFHENCARLVNNSRAYWLSPHHTRYIFPSVLPRPHRKRRRIHSPLEMCIIGSLKRKNLNLLVDFLSSLDQERAKDLIQVHLLGKSGFPDLVNNYTNLTKHTSIRKFVKFQHTVAQFCDVILPLMESNTSDCYFNHEHGKKKLSGSIVQSISYNIPMVVHEEIATLYQKERPANAIWETHNDDPKSFTEATTRMVESLGRFKLAAP